MDRGEERWGMEEEMKKLEEGVEETYETGEVA